MQVRCTCPLIGIVYSMLMRSAGYKWCIICFVSLQQRSAGQYGSAPCGQHSARGQLQSRPCGSGDAGEQIQRTCRLRRASTGREFYLIILCEPLTDYVHRYKGYHIISRFMSISTGVWRATSIMRGCTYDILYAWPEILAGKLVWRIDGFESICWYFQHQICLHAVIS